MLGILERSLNILQEILRVMKPGAAFQVRLPCISLCISPTNPPQLIEEELTFPGKPVNPETPEPVDLPTGSSSPWSSTSVFDLSQPSHSSSDTSLSSSPRPAPKPILPHVHTFAGSAMTMGVGLSAPPPLSPEAVSPRLLPVEGSADPAQEPDEPTFELVGVHEEPEHEHEHEHDHEHREPPPSSDPRDHSVLEHIYNEMHAARFINLEPLALLTNSLSLYFTGAFSLPHAP